MRMTHRPSVGRFGRGALAGGGRPRADRLARRLALAVVVSGVILVTGACTSSGKPGDSASSAGTPGPASNRPIASAPAGSEDSGGQSDAIDLLLLRRADPAGGYDVVEPADGNVVFSLPNGVISEDWRSMYAVEPAKGSTIVRSVRPEGGDILSEVTIDGGWRLPTIGIDHVPSGLSGDGSTLVLEEDAAAAPDRTTTRFMVVA